MQYREYGDTGEMVSALGFGAMRLPDDDAYAVQIMKRFLDLGGNLIDTAVGYGNGRSEQMVGEAVEGRREDVYISTKNHSIVLAAHGREEYSPDTFKDRMEQSFDNLGVDYIDYYHIHDFTWDQYTEYFRDGEAFEICQEALDDGRIRHLCFSSHDTPENIIKLIDTGHFDGMVVQYNFMDRQRGQGGMSGRDNEPAIEHAAENGMGVQIMGTLAGGRLAMGDTSGLEQMLPGEDASAADLGIRFVLSKPHVSCAMSGMNELEHVEENCASASHEEPLTDDERAAIDSLVERNYELAQLYCTGCEYCLPCPQDVAIPSIFEAMNYHRVWGLTDQAKKMYANLSGENAEACVECGECEEQCPQDLPIIEQLKESHEALSQ